MRKALPPEVSSGGKPAASPKRSRTRRLGSLAPGGRAWRVGRGEISFPAIGGAADGLARRYSPLFARWDRRQIVGQLSVPICRRFLLLVLSSSQRGPPRMDLDGGVQEVEESSSARGWAADSQPNLFFSWEVVSTDGARKQGRSGCRRHPRNYAKPVATRQRAAAATSQREMDGMRDFKGKRGLDPRDV